VSGPDGKPARLGALDAFRGLTMAAMVVVNNPGSWGHVYGPLRHAPWDGCTPTDLIFPFFLFIVGVSMAFARPPGVGLSAYGRVARRAGVLLFLGLLLNAFPAFDFANLRLTGVLQRIGVCYALAAVLAMHVSLRWQVVVGGVVLVGYGVLLAVGRDISPMGEAERQHVQKLMYAAAAPWPWENVVRGVDVWLLGAQHVYRGAATDPEGVLSTLPATVTVLFGLWAGVWLKGERARAAGSGEGTGRAAVGLVVAGVVVAAAGWVVAVWQPFNKPLWTPSYALWTGGLAAVVLGGMLAVCDGWRQGARVSLPLRVLGVNAIVLFVGTGLLGRAMAVALFAREGGAAETAKSWVIGRVFGGPVEAPWQSLAYALGMLAVWWVILVWMWRRGWQVKV
jgi:predicted acyltransferase